MRQWIKATEGMWLTQSDQQHIEEDSRVFVKTLPVNTPENWTEWSDADKQEWEKTHASGDKAMRNFIKKHCDVNKLMAEFRNQPNKEQIMKEVSKRSLQDDNQE